jgi:hypothetical protein
MEAILLGLVLIVCIYFVYSISTKESFSDLQLTVSEENRLGQLATHIITPPNTDALGNNPTGLIASLAKPIDAIQAKNIHDTYRSALGKTNSGPRIDDTSSLLYFVDFCYEKGKDVNPFSDREFAQNCGMCMTAGTLINGTAFSGSNGTGVVVFTEDKKYSLAEGIDAAASSHTATCAPMVKLAGTNSNVTSLAINTAQYNATKAYMKSNAYTISQGVGAGNNQIKCSETVNGNKFVIKAGRTRDGAWDTHIAGSPIDYTRKNLLTTQPIDNSCIEKSVCPFTSKYQQWDISALCGYPLPTEIQDLRVDTRKTTSTSLTFMWEGGLYADTYDYTLTKTTDGSMIPGSLSSLNTTAKTVTYTGLTANVQYRFTLVIKNVSGTAQGSYTTTAGFKDLKEDVDDFKEDFNVLSGYAMGITSDDRIPMRNIRFTGVTISGFTVSWDGADNATNIKLLLVGGGNQITNDVPGSTKSYVYTGLSSTTTYTFTASSTYVTAGVLTSGSLSQTTLTPPPSPSSTKYPTVILREHCDAFSGWELPLSGAGTFTAGKDYPSDASYILVPDKLTVELHASSGQIKTIKGPGDFIFCYDWQFNDNTVKIVIIDNTAPSPTPPPSKAFLVAGGGYSGPKLIYSTDGINWLPSTNGNSIFANTNVGAIAFNGIRWVAVSTLWQDRGSETQIAYSDDGKTWVQAVAWEKGVFTYSCTSLIWDGSKFIGGDTNHSSGICYSYDGIRWSKSKSSGFPQTIYTLAYNGKYYLTGNQMVSPVGSWVQRLMRSTDGIEWSIIDTTLPYCVILSLAWNGEYWLLGGNGVLYMNRKIDASDPWTAVTMPRAGHVTSLVWNDEMWVGVVTPHWGPPPYGYLMYSYDGVNWITSESSLKYFTAREPNRDSPITVAWNTKYWVVGGYNNLMIYSSDGKEWNSLPGGASLLNVCYQIASSFKPLVGRKPSPVPKIVPDPNRKVVHGNNGTVTCDAYCAGSPWDNGPWNGELPASWNGAKCVDTSNPSVGCNKLANTQINCTCEKTGTGWAQGLLLPIPKPSLGTQVVYGNNGSVPCDTYCRGNPWEGPWNKELPYSWNGAQCLTTSEPSVGCYRQAGKGIQCTCKQTGTGWPRW